MLIAAADGEQVYDPIYKQKVLSVAHGLGWLLNSLLIKIALVMHLIASTLESLCHKKMYSSEPILTEIPVSVCRTLLLIKIY